MVVGFLTDNPLADDDRRAIIARLEDTGDIRDIFAGQRDNTADPTADAAIGAVADIKWLEDGARKTSGHNNTLSE